LWIPALHENPATFERLRDSAHRRRDDGLPTRHRLYHSEREPFRDPVEHDDVSEVVGLLGLLGPAHEREVGFKALGPDHVEAPHRVVEGARVGEDEAPEVRALPSGVLYRESEGRDTLERVDPGYRHDGRHLL